MAYSECNVGQLESAINFSLSHIPSHVHTLGVIPDSSQSSHGTAEKLVPLMDLGLDTQCMHDEVRDPD